MGCMVYQSRSVSMVYHAYRQAFACSACVLGGPNALHEDDLGGAGGHGSLHSSSRGRTAPPLMTRDQLSDVQITTADEFESVLAAAVEKAIKGNVDVRGPWEFQTRGSTHDWEVEIVELARESDD